MAFERFLAWDGRGVFILRLDYGYDVPGHPALARDAPREAGSARAAGCDLALLPAGALRKSCGFPEDAKRNPGGYPGARALFSAEALLTRRRSVSRGAGSLVPVPPGAGLLLVARFPRLLPRLVAAFERTGELAGTDENLPDGRVPPLYARMAPSDPRYPLHLRLEWESGLARARGGVVLTEAACLMAWRGELAPAELATALGVTAGAARSYLNWMADAGLARRPAPSRYALRHPALAALFATSASQERETAAENRGADADRNEAPDETLNEAAQESTPESTRRRPDAMEFD